MQFGRGGQPALSFRVDRLCRLPDEAGPRALGRRYRRSMSGPQLLGVTADSLGGLSQLLRVDLDWLGHGEPFCQLAIDATSGAERSSAPIRAHQLTSGAPATQFVICQ